MLMAGLARGIFRLLPPPVLALVPRRPPSRPQPNWDREYQSGQWDYLDGPAEMPRYATIFGYARASNSHASVLDVGCGAGILLHWLDRDIERYVGIDLSSTAIEQARSQHLLDSARFEVADAATFNTNDRFDIIVLNEILYYMNSPDSVAVSV